MSTENKINPTDNPKDNTNPEILTNPEESKETENNRPEEAKTGEDKAKLKSKFNLLEQGRIMTIGNMEETSKNLIILGTKNSGKSTIFSLLTSGSTTNFSDNGTCGINYGFMRSTNPGSKKVLNIYEIGGGIENILLIRTIINNSNIESTIFLIVIDFAKPESELKTLLSFINNLRKIICHDIDVEILENMTKNKISQYPDKNRPSGVEVFPIETYVIGNKYDLLEKIDIDKLKWICSSLRYFSFANALNLIFYSSNRKEYIGRLYNTMKDYAFGMGKKEIGRKYLEKNSTKALYINYYADSLEEIGEPKIPVTVSSNLEERWRGTYDGLFRGGRKNDIKNGQIPLDEGFYEIYKEARIDHELKMFNDFKENKMSRDRNRDKGPSPSKRPGSKAYKGDASGRYKKK